MAVGTSYMIPIMYRDIDSYSVLRLIVYRGDCLGLLNLLGVLEVLGLLACLGLLECLGLLHLLGVLK